jgi:large repetitive protein
MRALHLVALLTLAAGCGGGKDASTGGDTGTDETTTPTTPTTAPTTGPSTTPTTAPTSTPTTVPTTTTSVTTPTPTVPEATEVDCGRTVLSAVSGVCDVSGLAGDGMVIRGTVLAQDEILLGGEVLVDDAGLITCAACDCSSEPGYDAAVEVNCAEGVVSPGLINPHDHITYTEGWPIDTGTTRYEHRHGWRGTLSTPSNPHGGSSTSGAGTRWGEIRMVMSGVTSMIGSGRADGMVRNLDYSGDAQEGLGLSAAENETFPLGDSDEWFEYDCDWDYEWNEWAVSQEFAFVPHVAEGINDYAAEEFYCQSRSDGAAQDFTEGNAAHVHSIGLSGSDYYRMAYDGAQIIWSPRSNVALYGVTADVVTFHRLGGTIALGTDWTYSGSMNGLRELACADSWNQNQLDGYFSDLELWRMATLNGAIASGVGWDLGSLEAGRWADISVFAGSADDAHRAVIEASVSDVALVLRGGEALYGEADSMSELGAGGDAVDVCGSDRTIATTAEFGTTYAAIASEVSGSYPAFFCDTPDMEPTCEPFRPGEFEGTTAADADGDGVEDVGDNCPTVFNPIRPVDLGVQGDADGDGIGDPCDVFPVGTDLDLDGKVNAGDNCPWDSNGDQADDDGDGKGNVCDPCPAIANPDGVCPPTPATAVTVAEIQDGTVPAGDIVLVEGVVVTGIGSQGMTVQDPAGGENSGIYVYTGSEPTVSLHDLVDVSGEVSEYFDETQIGSSPVVTGHGPTTPIAALELTTAEATDEVYEGVLVRITDGVVTDADYDCAVDGACADEGLWELGGPTGVVVFDRLYEDADWGSHIGEVPVTGVMGFRWERRRVMPRTSSDF